VFAAVFASASALAASVPDTRKVALAESLDGVDRQALERYLAQANVIQSRWLVLRVLGITTSGVVAAAAFPTDLGAWRLLGALGVVLAAYGIPAEVGMVITRHLPETALPRMLRLLQPIEMLGAPLTFPLVIIGQLVERFVHRGRLPSASLAGSEMEVLVKEGELNGSLAHDQSEMIRNVLDFGDIRAGDVMVPRTQVTAIDATQSPEQVLTLVAENAHSRYPVFRDRIDNVVGILHVKDLVAHAASHDIKQFAIQDVMRTPVVFVPETQSASSVLMDMRSGRRHHMAIIIDEFGGMSGIITLEDLIEEIVGDIRDEHDDEEPPIVDMGNGRLMVDARVAIDDLSRYLGVALPEDGDYNSLGGFLVERMGQVPEVGARLREFGLEFVVRDADDRHVAKVEIVPVEPSPESLPPLSSKRTAAA
jgi:putative hemolysin